MKIRTKILLSIFLSILITGLIAILISRIVSKNIIEDQIKNKMVNTALSNSYYIESIIEGYKKIAVILASGNFAKDLFDPEQDYEKALKWAKKRIINTIQSKKISRVRVLNDKGIVIVSSHNDTGEDDSKTDIFTEAKKGVCVGDIHVSRFTGDLVMSVAAPVYFNGKFSGVVVVNIDAENEFFNIMTNRIGLGETGEVYLINKHGYMITPSRFVDNAVLKQKIDIDHSENCINVYPGIKPNKAPKIGLYKNYMGQDVLRVHTHIPEVEWVLVVDVSTEEIFIPVFKLSNRLLIILIILLVAGVIISVVLSRTITRPVLKLHHGIEELEKGNLDFKVGTKAKDEIGELSRGFDKMTGELKKSKEILEDLNYELEQKVKVRTTELNAKINESEHQRIATLNILQEVDEVNKNLKQEISERVKTEKALQESEKKYRLLAENTLDCIWKTDKDMRFTYVNPAIFPMLGFTPEEWTGSSLSEHCSENEFKKAKNIIAEEMRKDDTYSATFEIALIHKDGKDIPVEINGKILIDENKKIIGLQGTTRDITERKIAAKELEQRLAELEIYYKATLGREGRIIELKQEINRLLERLGEKSRFGV